jgi:hypothetical protein
LKKTVRGALDGVAASKSSAVSVCASARAKERQREKAATPELFHMSLSPPSLSPREETAEDDCLDEQSVASEIHVEAALSEFPADDEYVDQVRPKTMLT